MYIYDVGYVFNLSITRSTFQRYVVSDFYFVASNDKRGTSRFVFFGVILAAHVLNLNIKHEINDGYVC